MQRTTIENKIFNRLKLVVANNQKEILKTINIITLSLN